MSSMSIPRRPLAQASKSTPITEREQPWIPELLDPSLMLRLVQLPSSPPSTLSIVNSIELTLTSHHFDHLPVYQALSYTWGCPYNQAHEIAAWHMLPSQLNITCNGYEVAVSRNLFQALKQIIALFPGALFWIDALCINQMNELEKSLQIQRMGDIYASADNVVGWLGAATTDFSVLSQVHERFQAFADARSLEDDGVKAAVRALILPDTSLDIRRRIFLETQRMFNAAWWRRTWTFQEYILARDSVLLVYGCFTARARHLQAILELLPDPNSINDPINRSVAMQLRGSQIARVKSADLAERAKTDAQPLIDALDQWQGRHNFVAVLIRFLSQSTHSEATVPRDHILSMLGACNIICQRIGQPVEDGFIPMHGSFEEISAFTAVEAFQKLPFLNVLRLAGIQTSSPHLPSWLPEFRKSENGTLSDQQYDASLLGALDEREVFAGRKLGPALEQSRVGVMSQSFGLQALKVGVVRSVVQLRHNISTPGQAQPTVPIDALRLQTRLDYHIIMQMMRFCMSLPLNYVTGPDREKVLWRTLFFGSPSADGERFRDWATYTLRQALFFHINDKIGGRNPLEQLLIDVGRDAPSETVPDIPVSRARLASVLGFDVIQDVHDLTQSMMKTPNANVDVMTKMNRARLQSDLPNNWQQDLAYIAENRIGVTIRRCQPGDQVWILQGGEYPVIMRPTKKGDHFRLVGDMYVGGIMHGEFVGENIGLMPWTQIWIV